MINLFIAYSQKNVEYFDYCIIGLTNLAELEDDGLLNIIFDHKEFFHFVFSLGTSHLDDIIKLLCNLTTGTYESNLFLLNDCNVLDFLKKGLEFDSQVLIAHTILALTNLTMDANDIHVREMIEKKIVSRILSLTQSFIGVVVSASLGFINVLCENHMIIVEDYLYKNNIIQIIISILEGNKANDILTSALKLLNTIVMKEKIKEETNYYKFKVSFEEKGGVTILNRILSEVKDNNLQQTLIQILDCIYPNEL